jgi:hypothetical protein
MNYPVLPGSSVAAGIPDEAYHRMPELSSSQAKALIESPAKFNYWRGKVRPPKSEYDLGHAVHAKVLGVGADVVEIPNDLLAVDGGIRTNAAKEWVQQARDEGKVPLKAAELRPINDAAEAVLQHPKAAALLSQPGHPEVSIMTVDPMTEVPIRARFDYLPFPRSPRAIGVDLKTSKDASPRGFAKAVYDYSYHLQQEWYRHAYRLATGEEVEFAFVVVELEPPYLVGYYNLSDSFMEMGRAIGAEARALYAECTRTDIWPGYDDEIRTLEPPFWAALQHEEKYADERA